MSDVTQTVIWFTILGKITIILFRVYSVGSDPSEKFHKDFIKNVLFPRRTVYVSECTPVSSIESVCVLVLTPNQEPTLEKERHN